MYQYQIQCDIEGNDIKTKECAIPEIMYNDLVKTIEHIHNVARRPTKIKMLFDNE